MLNNKNYYNYYDIMYCTYLLNYSSSLLINYSSSSSTATINHDDNINDE